MTADPPRGGPQEPDVRLLLEAATVTSELTLDGVLDRLVEIARRLVGARYAALGVLENGPSGDLRTFVHHGLDAATVDRIGDLPRGRGLLGVLVEHPVPVRLRDLGEHGASVGFPEHHPPMRSFLGVPVRVRGRVFGNLYLAEKRGAEGFTAHDEELAVALAATAGVAIENARLHEEARHREGWLRASAEVTNDLVASRDLGASLRLVLDRAREVAGADVGWIVTGDSVHALSLTTLVGMSPEAAEVARRSDLDHTLTRQVAQDGEPVVVADLRSDPRARLPEDPAWPRLGPAVLVPLRPGAGGVGVLALAWRSGTQVDVDRLEPGLIAGFAEQAALALDFARGRDERERLALLEDRDRIARDLHDLVLQRLFAVGLGLELLSRRVGDEGVADRLSEAIDELDTTIVDVRRTIFNLGQADTSADVQVAMGRMVDRAAGTLKVRPSLVFEGPVRSAVIPELLPDLLATLAEALSNAARHAEARHVDVRLRAGGGAVTLTVTDDGLGVAATGAEGGPAEGGLANLRERARRHGGSLRVHPGPGGGTCLEWTVPTPG